MVKRRLTCLIYIKVQDQLYTYHQVSGQMDKEILADESVIHVMNREVLTFQHLCELR